MTPILDNFGFKGGADLLADILFYIPYFNPVHDLSLYYKVEFVNARGFKDSSHSYRSEQHDNISPIILLYKLLMT